MESGADVEPGQSPKRHDFVHPQKYITTERHAEQFRELAVFRDLIDFINRLSSPLKGYVVDPRRLANASEEIQQLVEVLNTLNTWIDEVPPAEGSMRFGNKAFQTWHDKLQQEGDELVRPLLQQVLPKTEQKSVANNSNNIIAIDHESQLSPAVDEVSSYLKSAFGDRTRIDYGSGHELNFLCFFFCLHRLNYLRPEDFRDAVLIVFIRYLKVMRRLQRTYLLEPAGSRGVWGLDDFHFLPFLFGAAQLVGQTEIKPSEVTQESIVRLYADEYIYLDSIRWIFDTKAGVPFGECSPLLNDISAVTNWSKIHTGMIKMYQAEVLSKVPVMQHFLFGSILPPPPSLEPSRNLPIDFPPRLGPFEGLLGCHPPMRPNH